MVVGAVSRLWGTERCPSTAIWTVILFAVWEFGSPMLIFLAGLRQIPTEFYEAAAIDGAGPIRRFFSITIPLLSPLNVSLPRRSLRPLEVLDTLAATVRRRSA